MRGCFGVVVTCGLPTVPQAAQPGFELRVACRDGSAVAQCSQVLSGVKAVGGGDANGADWGLTTCCEVGLATVFDDGEAVSVGDRGQCR